MYQNIRRAILGLLGISFVIVIHELGHFSACKLFNVKVPVFSIGFNPRIIGITLGNTEFQLGALPLGGYTQIDPESFNQATYWQKMIIMLAGIFFNFLLAGLIYLFITLKAMRYAHNDKTRMKEYFINAHTQLKNMLGVAANRSFIGPIGLINLVGKSFEYGLITTLFFIAIVSINIGFFNLLPLPFLDGGKAVFYTIQELYTMQPSNYALLIVLFAIFILTLLCLNRLWHNKKTTNA